MINMCRWLPMRKYSPWNALYKMKHNVMERIFARLRTMLVDRGVYCFRWISNREMEFGLLDRNLQLILWKTCLYMSNRSAARSLPIRVHVIDRLMNCRYSSNLTVNSNLCEHRIWCLAGVNAPIFEDDRSYWGFQYELLIEHIRNISVRKADTEDAEATWRRKESIFSIID